MHLWTSDELMIRLGAYKERGALNKLKSLNSLERKAGIYAASAGNHAQGVAYHAGRLGIKSTIFMPVGKTRNYLPDSCRVLLMSRYPGDQSIKDRIIRSDCSNNRE